MARSSGASASSAGDQADLRVRLTGLDYYREHVSCQAACPAGTDARGMVTAIARGEYQAAWDIARQSNPFAAVCGSACSAPCQSACRRGSIDEPIEIAALQRFAANIAGPTTRPSDLAAPARAPENSRTAASIYALSQYRQRSGADRRSDARVAIIGAGPAGLTAAHDLALLGHAIDIFEASDRPGGMMLRGIPEYLIPRSTVVAEINAVLAMPGVNIDYSRRLGVEIDLNELGRAYDAVIVAVGDPDQWRRGDGGTLLSVPELIDGFRPGMTATIGDRVVIAGGCNRSIAAARSAVRIQRAGGSSADVTMVSEKIFGSPAAAKEAQREGVKIVLGAWPEPIVREGSTFEVPLGLGRGSITADVLVLPMGDPMLDARPAIYHLAPKPKNVIEAPSPHANDGVVYAVAAGHQAAANAEGLIQGATLAVRRSGAMDPIGTNDFQESGYLNLLPQDPVMLKPTRRGPFDQPDLGFTADEARAEARRCLKCNVNTVFESPRCITCGDCVDVCPHQCLQLASPEGVTGSGLDGLLAGAFGAGLDAQRQSDGQSDAVLILKDESTCTNCGLCAEVCPTDVIGFEWFSFAEELELLGAIS